MWFLKTYQKLIRRPKGLVLQIYSVKCAKIQSLRSNGYLTNRNGLNRNGLLAMCIIVYALLSQQQYVILVTGMKV